MFAKTGHQFVAEKGIMILMPSEYDNLFKAIITAGWCVMSNGHVESPQGYFSVTEVPALPGELRQMFEAVEEGDWEDWYLLPAGWYFTVEENSGLIFVYRMRSEVEALSVFKETEAEFAAWEAD